MRRLAGLEGDRAGEREDRLILLRIVAGPEDVEKDGLLLAWQTAAIDLDANVEALVGRRLFRRLHVDDLDANRQAVFAHANAKDRDAGALGPRPHLEDRAFAALRAAAVADHHDALHHVVRFAIDQRQQRIGYVGALQQLPADLDALLELVAVFEQPFAVGFGEAGLSRRRHGVGRVLVGPLQRPGRIARLIAGEIGLLAHQLLAALAESCKQPALEIEPHPGRPVVAAPFLAALGQRVRFLVEPAAEAVHHHRVLFHQPAQEVDLLVVEEAQDLVHARFELVHRPARRRDIVADAGDAVRHVDEDHHPRTLLGLFPLLAGGQQENHAQQREHEAAQPAERD